MKRPLKQAIAMLLVLCSMLALLVPAASAEASPPGELPAVEKETLADGVIFNKFSSSLTFAVSRVDGQDYAFIPYLNMLFVYNLDSWEQVDMEGMATGSCIGAFVDSNGFVWVYGSKKNLFRYDPWAMAGEIIEVPLMKELEVASLYHPIEIDGKLYFGTYGSGGAHIIEYDPFTGVFVDISGQLVDGARYCSTMVYRDGYIYATVQSSQKTTPPQCVVKFDMATKKVVDRCDITATLGANYFVDARIAGDVLLLSSRYQTGMIAVDISGDKMTEAVLEGPGIIGSISEEIDGKYYFFGLNHRTKDPKTSAWTTYCDPYCYDIATKTSTKLSSGDPSVAELRTLQAGTATIRNAELGMKGQYLITLRGNKITCFGLDGTSYEMPVLPDSGQVANRLTSLTRGPDGSNALYMGSYMNNKAAKYDLATGNITLTETYSAQVSQNFFDGDKWYVTNYGACSLSEVKNDGSVKTLFSLNEGGNGARFRQERAQNFTAGGNKVFVATVPKKGEYGGLIAWYDYDKKATYVAVEKDLTLYAKDGEQDVWYNAKTDEPYSFTRKFDGLIEGHMVKSLVYQDGLIYGCTTTLGGSATVQRLGYSAVLFVYDPVKMELVATCDIRDSIDGFDFDLGGFQGIAADPDVHGRFWGLFCSTLFTFTFDKEAKTFKDVTEVYGPSEKNNHTGTNPANWSPWKHYFSDGYLYYFAGGAEEYEGWIMMVSTADPSYYAKLPCNTRSFFVLGEDNNIYSARETSLYKWHTADLIAQIKADGPSAPSAPSTPAPSTPADPSDKPASPASPVLYIVIAVVALAAIGTGVIVLIRKKKNS